MLTLALLVAVTVPAVPADGAREHAIVSAAEVARDLGEVRTEERLAIEEELARIASRYARVQATTARELKKLAALEAERQLAGCDDACASELAAALGARWVLQSRVERAPEQRLSLALTLVDTQASRIVARARATGARWSDVRAQLPFAVDDLFTSLRVPSDPTPAQLLAEVRAKLAVLPVRGPTGKRLATAERAVDAGAQKAAGQLSLALVSRDETRALAAARGCDADDVVCALLAIAARGGTTALGVSVNGDGTATVARATLMGTDGRALARRECPVAAADLASVARAVSCAIDGAVLARLDPRAALPATEEPPVLAAAASATPAGDDAEDEVVVTFGCNVIRGIEGVGSTCTLGRRTLRIQPHALNVQSYPETVQLADVERVTPYAALGIVPSGVRLHLRSGRVCDLVVGVIRREEIVARFEEVLAR